MRISAYSPAVRLFDRERIGNLLSGEGSFKEVLLQSEIMAMVKYPVFRAGDILKFCSPLAYIPLYYHSIGRQVTKGHTKICLGATFQLSVVTKSKQHNEWTRGGTVCWCNQSQLRYSTIRVPKKYADLEGVVWPIS